MNAVSNISGNASSSTDNGDVYEFKSSKEPTPIRGASSSPNPNLDKDKDSKSLNSQGGQNTSSNVSTACISISNETTVPLISDEISTVLTSPSSKRIFEGENMEEQDEENRRKKRKDSEIVKENAKNNTTGRQSINRNVTGSGEKVRNKIKKENYCNNVIDLVMICCKFLM